MNSQKLPTLADYTKPGLIVPQLTTRTTISVMQELTAALYREDSSMPQQSSAMTAALIRELLTSTVLDFGAVFPQVSVRALSNPLFALGRSNEPLGWRASEFPPTEFVFLILQPSNSNPEFEQLVATLHGLGKDPARLDDLRRAASADQMLAVFNQIPLTPLSELPPLPANSGAIHSRHARPTFGYRRWRR